MRYFLVILLIVFILVGTFFVPLARGYIETKTDEIVMTLYDSKTEYAAKWAKAIRMSDRLLGGDIAKNILSAEAVGKDKIEFKLHQDSSKRIWAGAFFNDGTLIFLSRIKSESQFEFAYMTYESTEKIFDAFKVITERELG